MSSRKHYSLKMHLVHEIMYIHLGPFVSNIPSSLYTVSVDKEETGERILVGTCQDACLAKCMIPFHRSAGKLRVLKIYELGLRSFFSSHTFFLFCIFYERLYLRRSEVLILEVFGNSSLKKWIVSLRNLISNSCVEMEFSF